MVLGWGGLKCVCECVLFWDGAVLFACGFVYVYLRYVFEVGHVVF